MAKMYVLKNIISGNYLNDKGNTTSLLSNARIWSQKELDSSCEIGPWKYKLIDSKTFNCLKK